MTPLHAALARLEKLDAPCRETDRLIAIAMGWTLFRQGYSSLVNPASGLVDSIPRYTASLDAALTLVPAGWMVVNLCEWEHPSLRARGPWMCDLKSLGASALDTAAKAKCAGAHNAAIALCIAALRARLALEETGGV